MVLSSTSNFRKASAYAWSGQLLEMPSCAVAKRPPVASQRTRSQTFQNPAAGGSSGGSRRQPRDYAGLCSDEGDHCNALEQIRIRRCVGTKKDIIQRISMISMGHKRIIAPPAKPRKSLLPIALSHPGSKRKARQVKEVESGQSHRTCLLAKDK